LPYDFSKKNSRAREILRDKTQQIFGSLKLHATKALCPDFGQASHLNFQATDLTKPKNRENQKFEGIHVVY